ncbi:Methanogenic corrinoid protein MtbC1 [Paenibacillus polysaccharolyticus]|uniref:Methanogenic corrinoid protein MtbC1 n=1 Tax=Paenibacillus polysaccharolyticus TaxID=582692 RepID=A0A1G5KX65_9BACL|nr:cobalamin-dependent protein [Paenibacillus polysaccharolyticus]SCZ05177.1 Methanogenic corrinoid protein MtbC1 [Paenibacillus polysaccharolyticus]
MSHREAGERLLQDAEILAEKITEMQYRLQPDLMERFGPIGKIRTKQDSQYSLSYLAESVLVKSPGLFTHYISWLKVLLAGYQVSAEDLEMNLELIKEALNEEIEQPHREFLLEYLEMGIDVMKHMDTQASFIHASMPYGLEAKTYLQHLLDNKRKEAFEIVESELNDGATIRDMYRYIFQPVQYEIGRLWQRGQISVGQEHFCTAATQSFISRLYSRWLIGPNKGKKLVAACVGSEQHEIGLRMLTDVFEMEGWDTYYLGANVPNGSIVEAIKRHESDVIAISVTMTYHLHLAKELIERIRNHAETAHVKVMVGGYPFNIDKELWRTVGADGYAPGAEEAVAIAERLLNHPVSLDNVSTASE